MKQKLYKLLLTLFFYSLILTDNIFSQSVSTTPAETGFNAYNTFLIIFLIILLHVVFLPLLFPDLIRDKKPEEKKDSVFVVIKNKLSGAKPIEAESSILLEENFDGIGELDNKVPPWFNILFYGSIIIAVIYFFNYHVFSTGKLPAEEYADEMKAAALHREEMIRTGAFINENNVTMLNDEESINAGKQIFQTNCIPCHGTNAEGTVGPNLTDPYWLHGGSVSNVFKTVKYGVPIKGMISWQTQFNPKKMQQVVSYILSLKDTKPVNGKLPEGELYVQMDSALAIKDSLNKSTGDKITNSK